MANGDYEETERLLVWHSMSCLQRTQVFIGQVENAEGAENAEKDEKVVKCEKSCLLNQNMSKKPL